MTETKEQRLSKYPLFSSIPDDKLSEINKKAKEEILPSHTIIFQEGDPGNHFYLINSGKVRIFKKERGGLEISVAELGAGAFFGHVAILTEDFRRLNAETKEETHLTCFSKEHFENILREFPDVSLEFARQTSKWFDQEIMKLSTPRLPGPKLSWLDFFAIFTLSLLFGMIFNYSNPNGIRIMSDFPSSGTIENISQPTAFASHTKGSSLFVDARPPTLYENDHIDGAINVPLAIFDIIYMMKLSETNKNKDIIVYGRTISRHYDELVARKFVLRGHKNTVILQGGLSGWKKNGFPFTSKSGS